MTYITRIANKRILAKYFLYSLQINYLHWKLSASRSIFSCYATFTMFVSGVGGTGKSFLIATVKALTDSLWKTEDITCAIAAPTGLAAFNVGGIMLHRLFRLPVEHDSRGATCWQLRPESQKNYTYKASQSKIGHY